jgi:hypothetical protein
MGPTIELTKRMLKSIKNGKREGSINNKIQQLKTLKKLERPKNSHNYTKKRKRKLERISGAGLGGAPVEEGFEETS